MEMKQNSGCAIVVGSVNRAIRARDLLASAALFSKVVKVDGKTPGEGCAYAIEVPCASLKQASDLLRKAGIRGRVISDNR